MDTRASRCAMWKLHAPPSRYKEFNPAKERTAKLTPNRVTFLNGPNRDFPKRRRHALAKRKGPPERPVVPKASIAFRWQLPCRRQLTARRLAGCCRVDARFTLA